MQYIYMIYPRSKNGNTEKRLNRSDKI